MFEFIKEYLLEHPDEIVTIIEPGAGNGEFTGKLAKLIYQDENTRGRVNLVLKEFSKEMSNEGRVKFEKLREELKVADNEQLRINYIGGSADVPLQDQIDDIKQLLQTNQLELLEKKYFLNQEQANKLLNEVKATKVIGAVSTYTFGAMGKIAPQIARQTIQDVIKNGKIVFVDFAERPPDEYVNNDPMTNQARKRLRKLRKIYDTYKSFGFEEGLSINLGFWEHDVRQVWDILHEVISTKKLKSSSNVDLKPFGFIPIKVDKENVKAIALPGYFELFIRTEGLLDPDITINI